MVFPFQGSILRECGSGSRTAWERERARAKECGGASERSGGDGVGMEGDVDTERVSELERGRKRSLKFMTMV